MAVNTAMVFTKPVRNYVDWEGGVILCMFSCFFKLFAVVGKELVHGICY